MLARARRLRGAAQIKLIVALQLQLQESCFTKSTLCAARIANVRAQPINESCAISNKHRSPNHVASSRINWCALTSPSSCATPTGANWHNQRRPPNNSPAHAVQGRRECCARLCVISAPVTSCESRRYLWSMFAPVAHSGTSGTINNNTRSGLTLSSSAHIHG